MYIEYADLIWKHMLMSCLSMLVISFLTNLFLACYNHRACFLCCRIYGCGLLSAEDTRSSKHSRTCQVILYFIFWFLRLFNLFAYP